MAGLLTRILWRSHPRWQLIAGSGGFLLGLLLMMMAVHVYVSLTQIMKSRSEGGHQYEYLTITKPVSAVNSLSMISKSFGADFNKRELDAISKQSFVEDFSPVTISRFRVQSDLPEEFGFYMDLYFEAVPDRFLDTIPETWGWQEGDTLPIIFSRDALDVYNFNMTMMYDMPQISAETIMTRVFDITISGKGRQQTLHSHVVGFSYRYPSILAPESFVQWANERFGDREKAVSKVIIAVQDAANPEIKKWLDENSYQANTEKTGRQSFRALAKLTYSIAGLIGALFLILSLVIFVITLQLLLTQSQTEVSRLIELGYTPRFLLIHVLRQFLRTIVFVGIIALGGYILAGFALESFFTSKGLTGTTPINWASLLTLGILIFIALAISRWALGRFMRTLYHH